jgi:hypothetical protein
MTAVMIGMSNYLFITYQSSPLSAKDEHYCNFAYSALACFRLLSESVKYSF